MEMPKKIWLMAIENCTAASDSARAMSATRRGTRAGFDSVPASAIVGFSEVVVIRYSW